MEERRHRNFLGYRIFRTQRVVTQCLERVLASYNLTSLQWNALNQLERSGPLPQKELAALLHREPATITRSVDKMESAGLVAREADPHDRRIKLIAIQPAGSELLSVIQPAASLVAAEVQGDLTAEEMSQLIALLDRVYDNCGVILEHAGQSQRRGASNDSE